MSLNYVDREGKRKHYCAVLFSLYSGCYLSPFPSSANLVLTCYNYQWTDEQSSTSLFWRQEKYILIKQSLFVQISTICVVWPTWIPFIAKENLRN